MKAYQRILLLSLIAAALLAWAVARQFRRPPSGPDRTASAGVADDAAALQKELAGLRRENERLRDRLAAAEIPQTNPVASTAAEPAMPPDPAVAVPFDSILSTDEARREVREMVRQQQSAFVRRRVEADYEELLHGPDIPPHQRAPLVELLAKRRLAEVMAPLDMILEEHAEFDPQQIAAALEDREGAGAGVDDEIQSLLSPKAFEAYEYHRETLGARGEVDDIQQQLTARGMGLTEEQRRVLIDVVYLEGDDRTVSPADETAFHMQAVFGEGEDYGEVLRHKLDDTAAAYNRILDASQDALDASQHEALQAYYQEQLEQQEQQADITGAMVPLFRDLLQGGAAE